MIKRGFLLYVVLSFFLALFTNLNVIAQHPAPFVWLDDSGEGRMVYALFRNEFSLNEVPENAEINLYADSRYSLYVNGNYVNFGPVRCFPESPEFDTYNISPYLQKGENVIAVRVLSNGMFTYQMPLSTAGFCFWGEIKDGSKAISLSTPGKWICKRDDAYDSTTPRFSFAKAAYESYDLRKEDALWTLPGADTKAWEKVVKIKNQDNWGAFRPRTIPHLTQNEILAKNVVGMYTLANIEDIYSFGLISPDKTKKDWGNKATALAYTYIYSDKDQDVEAGLWWGDFWLNGDSVKTSFVYSENRNVHSTAIFNLKKGWNHLLVKYGMVWSTWDFYLALPKDAGLILSPTKDKESDAFIMTAGPFLDDERSIVDLLDYPLASADDLPKLSKTWTPQINEVAGTNPAWNVAWQLFEEEISFDPAQVTDIYLQPANGENTATILDMGGKQLGRIFIEFTAPEGTIIDIAFAEDMNGDKVNILKRPGLHTCLRVVAKEGRNSFATLKPFGLRYLQVNVNGANGGAVYIHKIGVNSQIYPFEKIGSFQCSDPMFNAIWELGWRTLLVCSEDTYTDTPFRERGTYAGDAFPEFAITLATSGDAELAKRTLLFFQGHYRQLFDKSLAQPDDAPNVLGEFPIITLLNFGWYVNWTNDLEFAQELYPAYKYMMDNVLKQRLDNGLINNGRCFIEWTQIDKSATLTTFQSVFAQALETLSIIAEKIGEEKDAEKYQLLSNELRAAIRANCWDSDKGAYRDGYTKEHVAINNHYPSSSAWPTIYGVTTPEQEEELRSFYWETLSDIGDKSRNRLATPYGGFYLLQALYQTGNADIAEMFIRKYWSPMILKYDDTAWENFDDGTGDDGGQGTLSHAWSGGPTYHLTANALGWGFGFLQPIDYSNIELNPQTATLSWAKGKIPHPNGVVEIDWKIVGDKLFYNVKVPEGVNFVVKPVGRLSEYELFVNGKRQ